MFIEVVSEVFLSRELLDACHHALDNNLAVVSGDQVLVVTDRHMKEIGRAFEAAAKRLTDRVECIEIPVMQRNGQEPTAAVAEKMRGADVVVMPLTRSLSWTEARSRATECGARIASMPGITQGIILRTFYADYEAIRRRVRGLCDILDGGNRLKVTTSSGTNITMGISGRKGRGRRGGLYTEPGAWGNLPCGEAFIAPLEDSAEGAYLVDASHSGIGRLAEPIALTVARGYVREIAGGCEASLLRQLLDQAGAAAAYRIAEFGIGCNDRASICGVILEDEKALGTCHIALGSNILFGGATDVDLHLDGVLTRPTVYVDDRVLIQDGRLAAE